MGGEKIGEEARLKVRAGHGGRGGGERWLGWRVVGSSGRGGAVGREFSFFYHSVFVWACWVGSGCVGAVERGSR